MFHLEDVAGDARAPGTHIELSVTDTFLNEVGSLETVLRIEFPLLACASVDLMITHSSERVEHTVIKSALISLPYAPLIFHHAPVLFAYSGIRCYIIDRDQRPLVDLTCQLSERSFSIIWHFYLLVT